MGGLENILDIASAIEVQGKNKKEILPKIVKDMIKREESFDISNIVKAEKDNKKNFLPRFSKDLFEKKKVIYNPLKLLSSYVSMLKDRVYEYYSKIKKKVKVTSFYVGYTDKLLTEIEDWGVIYFKTVFKNLQRLTPLGSIQRYLQYLWIYMSKKIK